MKASSFPLLVLFLFWTGNSISLRGETAWPPPLKGSVNGVATVSTELFLEIPPEVEARRKAPDSMPFVLAKTPPTVDLVYHNNLPDEAANGTGWTSWGDIEVASDGRVYTATGNHGRNDRPPQEGGGSTFLYCYDPVAKKLEQVVDVNALLRPEPGDPVWSKIHAGIHEGSDKRIYFSCTLNAGKAAYKMQWSERIAGGQLFRYDPETGVTKIIATFPGEVTPTTRLDRERNIWYANFEGKTGAKDISLVSVDLGTGKTLYKSPPDAVVASRNLALARDGSVFFNGAGGLWKYSAADRKISPTKSLFVEKMSMRSSTGESAEGWIYGTTTRPGRFFRYAPARDKFEILGPDFLDGDYTTVSVLSPDEKYVYYLPGAHGSALKTGTPVVQYEIASGQRKVLAFLAKGLEQAAGYVAGGTYGISLNADGSTLYVGFNGHPSAPERQLKRFAKGFGLTALAAIHIPESER